MRLSRLLVYLGVLSIVLIYIFFVEFKYKQAESERKEKTSRLLQLDKDSLTEIKIVGSKDQPIQIRKGDSNSWRVVSPIDTNADTRAVEGLITSSASAQPEKIVLEKDADWNLYGLEKPSSVVSFSANGKTAEMSFGALNPSKSSYYLRVQGDPRLFLVADTLEKSLNKSLFDVRDKAVVKFSPEDITAIDIIREGKQTNLNKTEGKWRITDPVDARAKTSGVRLFLMSLAELKAQEIVDSPLTENDSYGFDKSLNKIVLKGRDFSKTLTLGAISEKSRETRSPGNSVYLSVSGQTPVYMVEDKFFQSDKVDAESLTDKSITSFEPIDVEKIEIEFMDQKWLLSKSSDNKWKMEAPKRIDKLDDWLVSGLLWSLKDLNFKSEIFPIPEDLSKYHLNNSPLQFWLHQKGSGSPTTIRMGWDPLSKATPENIDSDSDPGQPNEASGHKKVDKTNEQRTPQTIYAIVEPHVDRPAIYVIDGGFVGRLRIDLEQLGRGK